MKLMTPEIAKLLKDPKVEIRLGAVRRFAESPVFPADLYLLALGDEDWRVRKEAAKQFIQAPDADSQSGFLIDLLRHPDNAGLRNAAIEILIGLGATAISELVRRLASENAEVRKFIIDILGEIGHPDCVADLLPHLQDENANVRYAVVETLGKLRAGEAVDALLDLLDEADTGLCFTILEALAAIGRGVPVARIAPFSENHLLRKAVFGCLGKLGEVQALPLLVSGTADPLRKTRETALLAIGDLIKGLSAEIALPKVSAQQSDFEEVILNYLDHQDLALRRAACYALCLQPTRSGLLKLLPLLADEELRADVIAVGWRLPEELLFGFLEEKTASEMAQYLIFLFGELRCQSIIPLATASLQSEHKQLRYVSCLALGKVAALQAIPLLGDRLLDPVDEIRSVAAESLRMLGFQAPQEVAQTLTPYLESNEAEVRLLAVRTLGSLPSEKVAEPLLLALKDVAPAVRCEALRSLKGGDSQRLLAGLSLALTDEVSDVRRLAAEALAAFPPQRVLPILTNAVEDPDPWVRMAAIRAIPGGDEKSIETILRKGLADAVGVVVIAALETLVRVLPRSAEDDLWPALENADPEVVGTAVRLLLAKEAGEKLLAHDSAAVRLAAVKGLEHQEEKIWINLLSNRLGKEEDAKVRAALANALRRGRAGG